jgi:hypothetical protein
MVKSQKIDLRFLFLNGYFKLVVADFLQRDVLDISLIANGNFDIVISVKASEFCMAVFVGTDFGFCVPTLKEQLFDFEIRGLRGKVEAKQTAVVVIFSDGHISLRSGNFCGIGIPEVSVSVHEIPIDDLLYVGMGEPYGIELFDDLCLYFFILWLP